jgi:(4S)-4-hydroxy-5-phosphonooxypentane-2,3-dione isomerase
MLKSVAMSSLAIALGLTAWLLPMRGEQATAQSGPLHILVVEYDIVPGEIDKYLTAVKELGAASVKEAGFRQQYITISQNDPNHVLLFEAWDNGAAHAAHVATDRFKKYQATTGNMIAKRNVRTFSSVAMLSP